MEGVTEAEQPAFLHLFVKPSLYVHGRPVFTRLLHREGAFSNERGEHAF